MRAATATAATRNLAHLTRPASAIHLDCIARALRFGRIEAPRCDDRGGAWSRDREKCTEWRCGVRRSTRPADRGFRRARRDRERWWARRRRSAWGGAALPWRLLLAAPDRR